MNLSRDLLSERQDTCHGRILIFASVEMLDHKLSQSVGAVEVGEPLREVDSAVLGGHFGHYREDCRANMSKLGLHGLHRKYRSHFKRHSTLSCSRLALSAKP